ncbi:SOS-response repressor and protease LexA [Piscinibacter sakaiensis]|uniref:LexA repressor n=1 Tax=Piscinibacter sakaiensis TaxID=1547922 RepID=A0A0K8P8E3_PISS1|nr:SOS-response repressor and protease LexA [Piscinibacter sakaiensis]
MNPLASTASAAATASVPPSRPRAAARPARFSRVRADEPADAQADDAADEAVEAADDAGVPADLAGETGGPAPEAPAPKLTERQQQIYALVRDAIETTGAPPTRAEIAQALGFRSANAAEEHLQALARKGVLELVGGTSRGIRLRADTLRVLQARRAQAAAQIPLPLAALAQLTLPLVGRVAAGSPLLAQEHIDRQYQVEASLFSRRPDYLLKVRGMSMRDAGILDGDLLAVQQARDARNGQIVVARLGDEVTVKRFERQRQRIRLLAENPDFAPIEVPDGDPSFAIEGLAVGLIRTGVSF